MLFLAELQRGTGPNHLVEELPVLTHEALAHGDAIGLAFDRRVTDQDVKGRFLGAAHGAAQTTDHKQPNHFLRSRH